MVKYTVNADSCADIKLAKDGLASLKPRTVVEVRVASDDRSHETNN